ncbi:STAS domain-containing protein [Nonomuraea sp. FMUSA5-5]|uniref:Anti-sigma factor antagonist n=1 Tax=Nonomuraea composti TaxID=2720023 RepID=A0ABX1AVT5_9ACTN|nr:STAS domain-containing protein [Nonomuraea sp. FMUSA5-5]NJP89006.1 STAS domain-containing protein [Nonomuraea sp. FMUSA5-5]
MQDIVIEVVGPVGDCAVLKVAGEVDVFTAPKLREQIIDLAAKGTVHVIADLSAVQFLDSTGLGVLVGGLKRLRTQDGTLSLVMTTDRISRIFKITGLTAVFASHSSVQDAITADPHWKQVVEGAAGSVAEWCGSNSLA